MKALVWILALLLVLAGGYYLLTMDTSIQPDTTPQTSNAPQVVPIEHATGLLTWGKSTIYFDPTGESAAFAGRPSPDIILITDIHGDHLSTTTLTATIGDAKLIVPQAVKDLLPADLAARATVMDNGSTRTEDGFSITAVPMYNIPESPDAFHTKGRGNGYLIERDGFRVYIAGDTGGTPEMHALRDIDIALIPMNLPYTMSVADAADAVLAFKPKQVYPYHYRGQSGLSDVDDFKRRVNAGDPSIDVVLARWYPQE